MTDLFNNNAPVDNIAINNIMLTSLWCNDSISVRYLFGLCTGALISNTIIPTGKSSQYTIFGIIIFTESNIIATYIENIA